LSTTSPMWWPVVVVDVLEAVEVAEQQGDFPCFRGAEDRRTTATERPRTRQPAPPGMAHSIPYCSRGPLSAGARSFRSYRSAGTPPPSNRAMTGPEPGPRAGRAFSPFGETGETMWLPRGAACFALFAGPRFPERGEGRTQISPSPSATRSAQGHPPIGASLRATAIRCHPAIGRTSEVAASRGRSSGLREVARNPGAAAPGAG